MTLVHPLAAAAGGDEESPWMARPGTADDAGLPEALSKGPDPGPAAAPHPSTEAGAAESAAVAAALTVLVDESPGLPPEERDYRTWCDP